MKLKFAIVGCGRIAQRHAQHIKNNGELVATCDIVMNKAKLLADEYKAAAYSSIDDFLLKEKNIDIVSICSPNGLHAEHTIKSLRAGFNVLCEKPMAINVHDCGEMIKEAEKANKRLFIIKQNRFNPPVIAVKELIDNNKLGKILSVQVNCFWNRNEAYYKDTWKGTRELDGGILYTQYSHFIDILYWLVGDVKTAKSFYKNYIHKNSVEFEDAGVTALEFYNGAIGTINFNINSFGKNMEGSISIFGEKGTVKIGGQYLNELDYQNIDEVEIGKLATGNPPNNYGQYVGSMSNHDKVYENVVQVLSKNGIITTSGYEGLKTVEIIDKIYNAI